MLKQCASARATGFDTEYQETDSRCLASSEGVLVCCFQPRGEQRAVVQLQPGGQPHQPHRLAVWRAAAHRAHPAQREELLNP